MCVSGLLLDFVCCLDLGVGLCVSFVFDHTPSGRVRLDLLWYNVSRPPDPLVHEVPGTVFLRRLVVASRRTRGLHVGDPLLGEPRLGVLRTLFRVGNGRKGRARSAGHCARVRGEGAASGQKWHTGPELDVITTARMHRAGPEPAEFMNRVQHPNYSGLIPNPARKWSHLDCTCDIL